jgi:1-acyl-sn-glycerol-3-phosphate acyltransferase
MMQLDYREQTQEITKPAEHSVKMSTPAKATPVTSNVCQWLTSILYPLGRRVVLPFYFRHLKVTGQENIPRTGPVILAPTHRSRWDALVIPYAAGKLATGRDLRYMVSEDEMKGLQGWFIRNMGGFPVNTKSRDWQFPS